MKTHIANLKITALLFSLAGLSGIGFAQSAGIPQSGYPVEVPRGTIERLRSIYEGNEFAARTFSATWLPDGSGYLMLERDPGTGQQVLVAIGVTDGKRTELVSSAQLLIPDGDTPLRIRSFKVSRDGNSILLEAAGQGGGTGLHHWMLDRRSGGLVKVKAGSDNSISPDGQRILFTEKGNLNIYDLESEQTIALTRDAVDDILTYGSAVWSPDGNRVAFIQTDESRVRIRSSIGDGDPSYPDVIETRFARVGETIPALRVGVVDALGKEITWLSIPIPEEGYYLGQVDWAGNSDELLVEKHSRGRDRREFFIANVPEGKLTRIYEESDPQWVIPSYDANTGLEWIRNYSAFVVLTEREGWRQAYVCSRDGLKTKKITPGAFDIIERVGVEEPGEWFYYCASPDNGTQKYLFRVRTDGGGKPERLTPMDQPGTHSYVISPDAKWAFHTYSSDAVPPVTELVKLPEHRVIRVLADNRELLEKVRQLKWQQKEFLKIDIGEGIVLDAWMIKPRDFDPARKYPVFVYVYGEPHGQTVIDSWGHAMADFHRVIADMGYLVVSIDNRGTPCPKGAAWRRAISGRLGPLSTEEQATAITVLGKMRPYVDLSRVGIWGWSGGGSNTLNAMFRRPDVYRMGIAVAPKPQPHLYNAWFQEIYMKTVALNPEGYRVSAPINFAGGLEGHLLIVQGTGETNTHIQITEDLVDRLIELGKSFDYMAYPHRDHGIREGKGTSLHLRVYMARYLLNNLPAGPR